jgi:hypothetical protein
MAEDNTIPLDNVIRIDDDRIKDHLSRIVRGSVGDTLNALLWHSTRQGYESLVTR